MSGIEDTSDDVTITQRFASSLAALGITSTPRYDGLAVMVEGVKVCARIDDHTPEGTMWRLELWVDVGEDDAAAAAASAEVVQSVVAMYGRRLLKGKPANLSVPTSDQCEGVALISDEKNVRTYAMWHPQWGGYVGKCVVTYCITKDDRGKQNNTCFDVKVWHDGDFPTDDDGGETQEFHYCDPEQLIRFGRRVIKAMNDGGVDIVDPVGVTEKRAADAELEAVAAQGVIDIVHNILESTLDVLPLGAEKHPRVASALRVRSEVDALKAENAKLRAALRQVEMAARFPDASDAWDQVRDGVSVLHG